MYTGIVQGAFDLQAVTVEPGLKTVTVELPDELLEGLTLGASVAMDGVCLTVVKIDCPRVSFDVMQQTLAVTTLDSLSVGDRVNIERSAKMNAEIGGHLLSGHIDTKAVISYIETSENNRRVSYRVPPEMMRYIFAKGFVALNGCSLTVADVNRETSELTVCYIPETLRVTTHGEKQVGDSVNLEIDRQTQVIVDTVKTLLDDKEQLQSLLS